MKEDNALGEVLSLIMLEQGIAKKRQVAKISDILGVSIAQAHRKLNGSSWDVVQLLTVLTALNTPPRSFFAMLCNGVEVILDGVFENKFPCKIYASNKTERDHDFVVFKVNDEWCVYAKDNAPEQFPVETKFTVVFIELIENSDIVFTQQRKPRIAIVDDDVNVLASMKELLMTTYDVEIFSSVQYISKSINEKPYDAYILDWIIGSETSRVIIDNVRNSEIPDAPIFIVTGQGSEVDADISSVIDEYDIIGPYQKPLRIDFLKSQLKRAIVK